MNSLLEKSIFGKKIDDQDIKQALYEICDETHASCNDMCPVYEKNHGPVNPTAKYGCDCFKNGKKMLEFLRN